MATKPRILIVEDEPAMRNMLQFALSQDFEVDEAADGEEALRQIAARAYDAVVLDVMLPGLDGYSVCETIRQMPEGRELKVVFCTARGGITGRMRGREVGAEAYVVKPFSPSALIEQLKSVLAAPTPAAQSEPPLA